MTQEETTAQEETTTAEQAPDGGAESAGADTGVRDRSSRRQAADSGAESAATTGHIHDMGLLDLRFAKTPEDLSHIKRISDVGMVLVSEEAASALMKISMNDVGTVVTVPQGVPVNCLAGQTRLSGEALAAGDPETILFIAGQLYITSAVTSVGYKELRVAGQMFAPRGSETAIGAKLTQMSGQVFYLPDNPRVIMGEDTFSKEFLDLLPEPTALVIMGQVTFNDDVTTELVQSKLTEIVLMGQIFAPAALIPILQVLTKEKMGEIKAK